MTYTLTEILLRNTEAMKKYNINQNMYIQITERGWKHLDETVGKDYVTHCILPHWVSMGDKHYYRLQCHEVMWLFGDALKVGHTLFMPEVLFEDKDIKALK